MRRSLPHRLASQSERLRTVDCSSEIWAEGHEEEVQGVGAMSKEVV